MTSKQGYSDLMTRIRNGYMAKLDSVTFTHTSRNVNLLRILRDEGFISGWSENVLLFRIGKTKRLKVSNFNEGTCFS